MKTFHIFILAVHTLDQQRIILLNQKNIVINSMKYL